MRDSGMESIEFHTYEGKSRLTCQNPLSELSLTIITVLKACSTGTATTSCLTSSRGC